MKKIVSFKKDLLFKTKVSEITSISLEHKIISTSDDLVSGEFLINGEYKMTEGSINREKYDFNLPFDIALGTRLNTKECVIDIDDFNYKLKDSNTLYVKIDLYIEGEEEPIPEREESEEETPLELPDREAQSPEEPVEVKEEVDQPEEPRTVNIVKDLPKMASEVNIMSNKADITPEDTTVNNNVNTNTNVNTNKEENTNTLSSIFNDLSDNETYATYRVYIVKEDDTVDKIIEKYGVDKDKLELYNNLSEIKPGDKLIIPSM